VIKIQQQTLFKCRNNKKSVWCW